MFITPPIYRPGGSPPGTADRLSVDGPYFVNSRNELVIRRSVTGFCLPKRYIENRGAEALAYMRWARDTGFNEIRAFSRVNWSGNGFGVEAGWRFDLDACTQMLQDAASLGLRIELVAHTYNSGNLPEMLTHLQAVDQLCLKHQNAMLEVANEPPRNGIPLETLLGLYRPSTPAWSSGQYNPTPAPAGVSLSHHSDRKEEWVRCFKDAWEFHEGEGPYEKFQPPFRGPVMLDEPPQVEQTIRDYPQFNAPDDWKSYGAGAAFFAAGATMHSFPELQRCIIPSDPTVRECIRAFIEGFRTVPLQRYYSYNRVDPGTALRKYLRCDASGHWYQITVRPFAFQAL